MEVREFDLADYDQVYRLWEATVGVGRSDTREEVAKKLTRDPDLFLVATEGPTVLGVVIGAWDGRRGWLYHLAVDPGHQGQGVGTALLAEVERRLRAKGALKMCLLMWKNNEKARRLYQRRGYEELSDVAYLSKELIRKELVGG